MPAPPRPPPKSNAPLVIGLVAFTAFMGAVPIFLHRRQQRLLNGESLYSRDAPLTAAQIRRGTYMNAGSKDIGRDTDWDHKAGLYKGSVPRIMDADKDSHTWVRPSSNR
ncbi:hypothetical protein AB1Y20_008859 [Prymnesium parvum]|uniref:Uncharacterized protein n=1 Tax=Prymnesium parvum TaxID=97485 RepID=A0AB34ISU6_PRYPA